MNDDADFDALLDVLCPMHVRLDSAGLISRTGPTLQKLRPAQLMPGRRFLEVFELNRPRAITSMYQLMQRKGTTLHLQFRDKPMTGLKGVIVPLPKGQGAIVNLSFGISVLDAVRDYALSSADFSATDLTIELLYLVEAKSAAMDASRKLNIRLQGAMIAAEEQAYTDMLTGLRNRRAMDFLLERLIAEGNRFSLMHIDLDFFKEINDTLGHAAGDHVLRLVARIMNEESRESDCVARVGGDEFVIIFNRLVDRARLEAIAGKLIERIQRPIAYQGRCCNISASIGMVVVPRGETPSADMLLHQADTALYAAKHAGRGTWRFYRPDMTADEEGEPETEDSEPRATGTG